MAENVKRRVAAARMAVAFVAAGTIAGAAAWAQGAPPPTAQSSAVDVFIKGENVVNGSLFFEDFHKGEVPAFKQFVKAQRVDRRFKKATNTKIATIKGELGDIKTEVSTIKGELVSGYLKTTDADSRYLKLSEDVVRGDGSVFTETVLLPDGSTRRMLSIAGLVDVDAVNGPSPHMKVTNTSGGALTHTSCANPAGGVVPAGVLGPGQSLTCDANASSATQTLQLIGVGAQVATLSFSGIPVGQTDLQFTTQILIGL